MRAEPTQPDRTCRRGMTLIEVLISTTILTLVMTAAVVGVQREARGLSERVGSGTRERLIQELVQKIESRLEFAAAALPDGTLLQDFGGGSGMWIDSTLGFPPIGSVLVDPGTSHQERLGYRGLDALEHVLFINEEGLDCTEPSSHAKGAHVLWTGSATAIENQENPLENQYDGEASGAFGTVFYRGDGTGFSFRVPTDPEGGSQYFDTKGVRWGATVAGKATTQGWASIFWLPVHTYSEKTLGRDINSDGDRLDEFQVGRLHYTAWNAFENDVESTHVGLCPPIVLQEKCNHGGDLDGDGFDEPIFLWNPLDSSLHVRLTILTSEGGLETVQTTVFLRNGRSQSEHHQQSPNRDSPCTVHHLHLRASLDTGARTQRPVFFTITI